MASDPIQSWEIIREQQRLTQKWIRCDADHCGRPAIGSLDCRYLCLDHFISLCYRRLDECSSSPSARRETISSDPVGQFLEECIDQSAALVPPLRGLDNLDRARLFDIFLWASELKAKRELLKPVGAVKPHS
jgi:hypothetical protein